MTGARIEQCYFAWVEENEEFDIKKHCVQDLSVLKIHLEQKRGQSKGQIFATVKLLLSRPEEVQMDKFLMISVAEEVDNNITQEHFSNKQHKAKLLVKCKPICMSQSKIDDVLGYVLELHAKSSDFYQQLDKMRKQEAFDERFVQKKDDYHLVDYFLMTNRKALKIEKMQIKDSVKADMQYQEDKHALPIKHIKRYFPHTLLQYQKSAGISELDINLILQWKQVKLENKDIKEILKIPTCSRRDAFEIKKQLKSVVGKRFGKCKVLEVEPENEKINFVSLGINDDEEQYNPELNFMMKMALSQTKEFFTTEEVNVIVYTGVAKDYNTDRQKINFYLNLDPYLKDTVDWQAKQKYQTDMYAKYEHKRYKCLEEHISSDSFDLDRSKWECESGAEIFESSRTVFGTDYGKELLYSLFHIIKHVIEYVNHSKVVKVQMPVNEVMDLEIGDYVRLDHVNHLKLDHAQNGNLASDKNRDISGMVTSLDIEISDRKSIATVEMTNMLPTTSLQEQYEKFATSFKQTLYAEEDYMNEQYMIESLFAKNTQSMNTDNMQDTLENNQQYDMFKFVCVRSEIDASLTDASMYPSRMSLETNYQADRMLASLYIDQKTSKIVNKFKLEVYPTHLIS